MSIHEYDITSQYYWGIDTHFLDGDTFGVIVRSLALRTEVAHARVQVCYQAAPKCNKAQDGRFRIS